MSMLAPHPDSGLSPETLIEQLDVARQSIEQTLQAAVDDAERLQRFVQVASATLMEQAAGRSLYSLRLGVWRVHGHGGARQKLQSPQEALGIYVFAEGEQLWFHCVHNGQTWHFDHIDAAQHELGTPASVFARWIDTALGRHVHGNEGRLGIALQAQPDAPAWLAELYPKMLERTARELEAVYRAAVDQLHEPLAAEQGVPVANYQSG